MVLGGTKVYCPHCQAFQVSQVVPLSAAGLPSPRRWKMVDSPDIAWFRRMRLCSHCGTTFVTAEVEEGLLSELAALRKRLKEQNARIVRKIRRENPWLHRTESVPKEWAMRLVAASAWWLTHASGNPVRAPRHANNIYLSPRHGWSVDFGANAFLAGKAIFRCRAVIDAALDECMGGRLSSDADLAFELRTQITGSVSNVSSEEYNSYPTTNGRMVFGAQAIDVDDAVDFFLRPMRKAHLTYAPRT